MSIKQLIEHHLEFLSLKGGCTGWSEATLVKMPYCWKSHVASQRKITKNSGITVLRLEKMHMDTLTI